MTNLELPKQHRCGRRDDGGVAAHLAPEYDTWRSDGTCSYCGSISSEEFFRVIEAGGTLGPTDKSYKVYVDDPNPTAGQPCIVSTANWAAPDHVLVTKENRSSFPQWEQHCLTPGKTWVRVGPEGPTRQRKFYFQHLTPEGRTRFVELYNEKKMKIGYPGHFYTRPYFCKVVSA